MKVIKFRGKYLGANDWIYGSLIIKRNEYYIGYVSDISGIWSEIQVEPKTVGQWTGLKDEHGKEIYENDICKNMLGIKGVIVFDIDKGGYCIENKEGFFKLSYYLEVLGNLYENPEIL